MEKPFQMFRCSRSSAGMTQKGVIHQLSNRIFRKLFVNSNQPFPAHPAVISGRVKPEAIFTEYLENKTPL